MPDLMGFWSYVHADDEADRDRIRRLASDVKAQFEMLTGDRIELFFDKDDIEWGENWRRKVDESLALTAFFIPVLTPRYFMSPECRREVHSFALKATDLGVRDLLLPLLYVDVVALHDDETADELAILIKTFQWEDWRELRFADIDSEAYRRGVARLAGRLVDANRKADGTDAAAGATEIEIACKADSEVAPGILDRLAAMEEAFPMWTATVEAVGVDVALIGELMGQAAVTVQKGDAQGKGFAARLAVARDLALKLGGPSDRILAQSNRFASQLHEVDSGMRVIIESGPEEVRENPGSRKDLCDFFETTRQMAESVRDAMESTQEMVDGMSTTEALSRDLRAPLRNIRQGLTTLIEGREVTDEWVRLIDAAEVDCRDVAESDSEPPSEND